jgi:thiol-disulfide isomerase/thioredoxin
MNNKKLIVVGAVALVFGGLGAVFGTRHKPPTLATPATALATPSAAAPDNSPVAALYAQSLNDAAGKPHTLSQWKGKALVVNFWAPWCAPCVKEMPELAALAADSAAKNINVIGIGIDSPTNIAEFAAKVRVSYPLYVAGMSGTELSRGFGNTSGSLPYTVLIGADGKVRKTYLGQLKFDQLRADMAAL